MENFVFSVNATFPIFLVMLAGWVLRRFGMLTQGFVDVANRFNFYVTLPILLFTEISTMSLSETFDPAFFFYCMGATAVGIGIIWALSGISSAPKRNRACVPLPARVSRMLSKPSPVSQQKAR